MPHRRFFKKEDIVFNQDELIKKVKTAKDGDVIVFDEYDGRFALCPNEQKIFPPPNEKLKKRFMYKEKIKSVMQNYKGKEKAITMVKLLNEIKYEDRYDYKKCSANHNAEIRDIISEIVEDDGIPILSSQRKPRGYYYGIEENDFLDFDNHMEQRVIGLMRHRERVAEIFERLFNKRHPKVTVRGD